MSPSGLSLQRHVLLFILMLNLPHLVRGEDSVVSTLMKETCRGCHVGEKPEGGFTIESLSEAGPGVGPSLESIHSWERILRRLRAGQMPPPGSPRPDEELLKGATLEVERQLEHIQEKEPFAGNPERIRRLNRTEYQNAIRDWLGVPFDASNYLPKDEASHGFDNIAVGELTPTLLQRYLRASELISRLAMGGEGVTPLGTTVRIPPDRTQEKHIEGLPMGTRGGVLMEHLFPRDGIYEFQVRLTRDRDEKVDGLNEPHNIDLLIDRTRLHRFEIRPPKNRDDHTLVDSHLKVRLKVEGGQRRVGVTFPSLGEPLLEIKRQPFDAAFNRHRHPRSGPAVYEVSIVGPFESSSPGDTPSRRKILGDDRPNPSTTYERDQKEWEESAIRILKRLMRIGYRRPITEEDLDSPMFFFREGARANGFDAGIEAALTAILVNPHFLFRVEQETPAGLLPKVAPISDLELATRLSFFLWSSLPDDRLLRIAEEGKLHEVEILRAETNRMLQDERSESLISNFASQWLYLRNLEALTPDLRLFPDFDDNLRHAFRSETESLLREVLRENRSVLHLIQSDSTYLNERLAKHYGIPHVLGSHFRKVALEPGSHRGGILRHGSILTLTSYANRTSPTIRGHWILKNIIGTPPPPPPPNVPTLKDKGEVQGTTLRERLAMHRADAACASCHNLLDPIGFSLERYDALGRWRNWEEGEPIQTASLLPDGTEIDDVEGLEASILKRPHVFVGTMVEKLMTFGIGRGIEPRDGAEVRKIVRNAEKEEYRFSAMIEGIVTSQPFLMRSHP